MRVLELSAGCYTAAYCCGLLSRLGHDVVKLEWGDGDSLRRSDPLGAIEFGTTLGTKTLINVGAVPDQPELAILLESADAVVVGGEGIQLISEIDCRPPGKYVFISPFGLGSEWSDWAASGFGVFHSAGLGSLTPRAPVGGTEADVAPLAPFGRVADAFAGVACATLVAGQLAADTPKSPLDIDVSIQETLLPLVRRELAAVQYDDARPSRFERLWKIAPSGLYRALDGFVYVSIIEPHEWAALCELVDSPILSDATLARPAARFAAHQIIDEVLGEWLAQQPLALLLEEADRRAIPIAPVMAGRDVLSLAPAAARGFASEGVDGLDVLLRMPHGSAGAASLPWAGLATPSSGGSRPWPGDDAATQPGIGFPRGSHSTREPVADSSGQTARGGLEGIRVLEFGHVWAGPYCGQLLASMGAEVIRVESRARLDIHRRTGPFHPDTTELDSSGVWNAQNRGKKSVTLNLKEPRARELALQLAAKSDIVIENFRSGTMDRLGLGFAELRAAKPDIVLVSLTGFGRDVPLSNVPAYGPMMDAFSGVCWATRTDGGPNSVNGWFPDVGAALFGALKATALVTGPQSVRRQGVHVDVSELEAAASLIADSVIADVKGAGAAVRANASLATWWQGTVKCAGEDEWLSLELSSADEAASVLSSLRERQDRIQSPNGATNAMPSEGAIIASLREMIQGAERDTLCSELQSKGHRAVPVLTINELLESGHLARRGAFRNVTRDDGSVSLRTYDSPLGTRSASLGDIFAPRLGQDNVPVLRDLLGLAESQIADLEGEKVLW